MTASSEAKARGFDSLASLAAQIGVTPRTLNNWYKATDGRERLFQAVLIGASSDEFKNMGRELEKCLCWLCRR